MSKEVSSRIGVVASALGADPRISPRVAREAGFRGVLFDVWSGALRIPELTASGRRDFRHILSSQEQQLVGLQMDLGPRGLMPGADVDREIARIGQAMESAAGLQAQALCIDLGPLPRVAAKPKPRPKVNPADAGLIIIPQTAAPEPAEPVQPATPDPAAVAQVQAALVEIGRRADRYSVTVAFSSSLSGFAALSQALLGAHCPWFGVDLDPIAILRDELPQDEIFSMIGPMIRHVRARDAVLGDDKRIKPAVVGRGSTDWRELPGLLDEAGYNGFITLDPLQLPDRAAAAVAGAKLLRGLSA
jgi:sugar phosphate isomerase/epimerase